MKKTQRFFALILCVIMLFSILGCGQAKPQESKPESTITESSVPESKPESSTPKSKPESSVPEISTPESNESEEPSAEEDSKHDPEEIVMVEPGMDENIPSIDELIANDYALQGYPNEELMEPTWGEDEEHYLEIARDTVCRYNKWASGEVTVDYIFNGNVTDYLYYHEVAFIASDDKILQVLYNGQIKTLYTSPDGEKINAIFVRKNYIYFVENGYLNIMTLDASEIKEICEIGEITRILPADSNTVYITKEYYKDKLLYRTENFDSIDEKGNFIDDNPMNHEGPENTDWIYEYSVVELIDGTITQFDHPQLYSIAYNEDLAENENKPKA